MLTLLAILLVVPNALAEMSVLTGTRFDLFTTDGAPETIGYEVTFPVGLTYTWRDFTLAVNTAYGSANVYPGSGSREHTSCSVRASMSPESTRSSLK